MQPQVKNNIIYVPKRKIGLTPIVLSAAAFLFLALGAMSVFLSSNKLPETTELRKQASVSQGQVIVSAQFADVTATNNTATITFQANTNGVQTDGIQLMFNVVTDTTGTLNLTVDPTSGLQAVYQEVEKTSDGFLVSFIAIPPSVSQTFSSTSLRSIAHINFVPTKAGSVQINFDQGNSISTIHNSDPVQDTLRTLPQLSYNTVGPVSATATPTPSPTVTPSPTATPISPATCNQTCTSNAQCGANLRCYNGACRLATNVSSTSCVSAPDSGLNRRCNDYCADTNECSSGLTCFSNRCRLPENPDSQSCAAAPNTVTSAMAANCGVSCSSNSQCAVNMRCYNSACRLATNPGSLSCSPATKKTVSSIYSGQKGDEKPLPSSSASPSSSSSVRPSSSPVDLPVDSTDGDDETSAPAASALDELVKNLESRGISLPMAAIAAGIILLVIALLSLLSKSSRRQNTPPKVVLGAKPTGTSTTERSLEQRINELKSKQNTPPTRPVAGEVTVQTPPPSRIQGSPAPQAATPAAPTSAPSSSMMERIKNKGVMDNAPEQKPGSPT